MNQQQLQFCKILASEPMLSLMDSKLLIYEYVRACNKGLHSWILDNLDPYPIDKFEQAITIACNFL